MTYFTDSEVLYRESDAHLAHVEQFDADFPGWEEREADPERFVSEHDYAMATITAADSLAADWEAFMGFGN